MCRNLLIFLRLLRIYSYSLYLSLGVGFACLLPMIACVQFIYFGPHILKIVPHHRIPFAKPKKTHNNNKEREKKKKNPQKKKKETFCLTYSEGMLVCINVYFGGWVSDAHSLRWFSALLGLCAKTAHGHSNRTNTRIIYTKKKQIYKKLVVRCSSRNRSILFVS